MEESKTNATAVSSKEIQAERLAALLGKTNDQGEIIAACLTAGMQLERTLNEKSA